MDPQKPVLSRSALSCERKGGGVTIIAHEETPTGAGRGRLSLLLSPPLANVSLGGANLPPKAMGFLIPRVNSSAGQFRVPGSQFRVGWENSGSTEPLGKRGVPLSPCPPGAARRSLGDPYASPGPFPVTAQRLKGIASDKHFWRHHLPGVANTQGARLGLRASPCRSAGASLAIPAAPPWSSAPA